MLLISAMGYLHVCLPSIIHCFAYVLAQEVLKGILGQPCNVCFPPLQVGMLPAGTCQENLRDVSACRQEKPCSLDVCSMQYCSIEQTGSF